MCFEKSSVINEPDLRDKSTPRCIALSAIIISHRSICDVLRDLVHLFNFKNVKNIHGGLLLLVKLQVSVCNLLKVTLVHGCFSRFLNGTNCSKSRKAFDTSMFQVTRQI